MTLKLLSADASPFARKVRVLLHETGQAGEVEILTPDPGTTQIQAANPAGKIPTLIREDGPAIYDSRVICRFLDARAEAGLYPEARQWETLTLEATADAIMDAALLVVYETRFRAPEKVCEDWIARQWGKVESTVAAVNERWMSHLNGPLDISHIAMGCALGYLDFRHAARDWRAGNTALADWYGAFADRESMVSTAPA